VNGQSLNRVARLNTNGTVDTAFSRPSGLNSAVNALAPVANNGVVVVGGFSLPTPGITRYRTDGSIDTTFDPGSGINGQVHAVFVQQNSQVLIGGAFTVVNTFPRAKVARLNADGLLDQTFNPATNNGVVFAVAGQPDGKVIIGGTFTNVGGFNRRRIARLNVNGSVDTGFNPGAGANGSVNALVLQSDGRIIIGGDFTSINGTNRNRFARLNSNGSLDLVFDPGRGADGSVLSVALLPDGKVILGGAFTMVNGFLRRGVARVNGDTPALQFVGAAFTVGGEPSFTFSSQVGIAYATEATTDFLTWTVLGTNVAAGYTMTVTDSTATGLGQRFYRVRRVGP
jgi:uncharacterized delta-60 repeat protein